MHMYVSVYVHAHVYVCIYIYKCMHMYTCNKYVIENTTYCYIYDKIQCDAITARSVFSKHSHKRHTMARPHGRHMGVFGEFKVWFHIPYQSPQSCLQSEVYIPPRYDGTPLCEPTVPPLRGRSSCSRQEREIYTDNIADGMQRNIIKSENVSPRLCRLKIYFVSLINSIASNPAYAEHCLCI